MGASSPQFQCKTKSQVKTELCSSLHPRKLEMRSYACRRNSMTCCAAGLGHGRRERLFGRPALDPRQHFTGYLYPRRANDRDVYRPRPANPVTTRRSDDGSGTVVGTSCSRTVVSWNGTTRRKRLCASPIL